MRHPGSWTIAAVALACATLPLGARAAGPPAGDTPQDPIPLTLDAAASVPIGGGAPVWLAFAAPGAPAALAVDLAGSDVDTTLGVVLAGDDPGAAGPPLDEYDPHAAEAVEFVARPGTTLFRVSGAEAGDAGTARIVVRDALVAADAWATPAALDLAGGAPAISGASRALTGPGLEPGEPGAAQEGQSLWWRFVARATGPLVLDTCIPPYQFGGGGHLRVLTDEPLGQATVLADATQDGVPLCASVSLDVTAGTAYRVQSTVGAQAYGHDPGVAILRARTAGTPPAISAKALTCDSAARTCVVDLDVQAAPGAALTAVDCRVEAGPWIPCAAGGPWAFATSTRAPTATVRCWPRGPPTPRAGRRCSRVARTASS